MLSSLKQDEASHQRMRDIKEREFFVTAKWSSDVLPQHPRGRLTLRLPAVSHISVYGMINESISICYHIDLRSVTAVSDMR